MTDDDLIFRPLDRLIEQRKHIQLDECKDEWLGNGLDGKGDRAIPDLIDVTIDRREAYAKAVRIGLFQFWNVIGHRASVVVEKSGIGIGQKLMEGR